MYVSPTPILPQPSDEKISALVTHILEAKRADPAADVSPLEAEIDQPLRSHTNTYELTEPTIRPHDARSNSSNIRSVFANIIVLALY